MFLTENFKTFLKSTASASITSAYSESSFASVTTALRDTMVNIKSRLSCFNCFTAIGEMMLQDEDPDYNRKLESNLAVATNEAIHATELGPDIYSGMAELVDLIKNTRLTDGVTPTSLQKQSLSVFGPDGKEYDFVLQGDDGVQVDDITILISTCEDPTEKEDAVLFVDGDGSYFINPVIRGCDFMNAPYYPADDIDRVLLLAQILGIEVDQTDNLEDILTTVANALEVEISQSTSLGIANEILDQYYHYSGLAPEQISDATHQLLEEQYTVEPYRQPTGSITTLPTLVSNMAELASVDEIMAQVADSALHFNFSVEVIQGFATGFQNMRSTFTSAVNKMYTAYSTGGLSGLITYIVEYYRQLANGSADSTSNTWTLTDQATLVPKNFVANISAIAAQAFSAIATVVGAFFGVIGMAISTVVTQGVNAVSKLINFVNDKGRCFYTDTPGFIECANCSIWQTYFNVSDVNERLLDLLSANFAIYTIIPGGLMILSLDEDNNRVVMDVHPLYNSVDLSTAYTSIGVSNVMPVPGVGVQIELAPALTTVGSCVNWYAQHVSPFDLQFDPNASEVRDGDPDVARTYVSADVDALLLKNIRVNTALCIHFILLMSDLTYSSFGLSGPEPNLDDEELPIALLLNGFRDESNDLDSLMTNVWQFRSTWTVYMELLDKWTTFTRSLWSSVLAEQDVILRTDHVSSDAFVESSITIDSRLFITRVVTAQYVRTVKDFIPVSPDVQYCLLVPKWNAASFWAALILGVVVTAVIAATVLITSKVISNKIAKKRAMRQASVEKAWSDLADDPNNPALYSNYRKAVRKNNLFANVFGGTKYSKNNYWETIGSDDSPCTTAQGEGNTLITRLYDSYTGAENNPQPTLEIVQLIRGA